MLARFSILGQRKREGQKEREPNINSRVIKRGQTGKARENKRERDIQEHRRG
jgi:hypothetical protein